MAVERVTISEVALRDGLQIERRLLSVDEKLTLAQALVDAGLTRIEATGFVHPKVVPQFADAEEMAARLPRREGLRWAAYIPNRRGAERAVAAGIDDLKCGMAASDSFNKLNVRMSTEDGMRAIDEIAQAAEGSKSRIVGVVATAFGCPYEGEVSLQSVERLFGQMVDLGAPLIYLADTTGMADPRSVTRLVEHLLAKWPQARIGLHLHNTRGLGVANALAGLMAGVADFETSIGGLGGCPFAPRAVGNTCTEDFVHMLGRMGIETGLDLDRLIHAAGVAETLVDRSLPGMVMKAGAASARHRPGEASVKLD